MHTWTYDAPSGVFKNHVMSGKLRHAAIVGTKMTQFVVPEPGYGKKKGESITITRVSNMSEPTTGKISESQRIPEDTITLSTKAITVSEWGRAVPYTSLDDDLGTFNVNNIIQRELRKQMELLMDKAVATALKSTDAKVKAIPTGVAALTFDTDGTPSYTATSNLLMYHVEQIRDYMFSTLAVPPYEGDNYIALVSTKAKRGLINDPNFEKWHTYSSPETKFNSEIGKIENTRFIEIGNTNALSGSKGSGGVLGEAIFMGEDAVVMAVAQDPELRAGQAEDFGRKQAVAWYGILEFGLPWDTANVGEARVVHVTSA